MATGNCVVANHVAEHEEVLGDCGVLYKFNDIGDLAEQLRSVLLDKDKRETYARMARARIAENYAWNVIAEKYEALLSRVAGKASKVRTESSAGQIMR
jgi:glycosyltransferase involved in cell wall biosynthesis